MVQNQDNVSESAPAPRLDHCRVLVLFGGDRMFGSEIANLEVFRQMATLGLKARFITRSRYGQNEIQPELDRLGFEWTTAPFGYHWGKYIFGRYFYYFFLNVWGVIRTSWVLWQEIRNWRPTHLYCMNWVFFSYALPAILWFRLPLIYRAGDELPTHTRFHRWLVRKLLTRVDGMVCISRYIMERFQEIGMSRQKIQVVHNYPPQRADSPSPHFPHLPPDAAVFVFIGQISEHKGVVVLLDAVERLVKQGRNLVLWLVGDTSSDQKDFFGMVKQRVTDARLEDRIVFFGFVKNVYPILERSDVLVCPSLSREPLSNVVGEAKSCGKPSVVFPSGGLPELIEHGVDGYICRDRTVEALVEGIEFFVSSRELRDRCGDAARRSLETKFGLERFRRAWVEVFMATATQEKEKTES